jgi:hypothetical protein
MTVSASSPETERILSLLTSPQSPFLTGTFMSFIKKKWSYSFVSKGGTCHTSANMPAVADTQCWLDHDNTFQRAAQVSITSQKLLFLQHRTRAR